MFTVQAKVDEIRFLEDNKKIFTFFKYAGMYLIKHDGRQFRVSFGLLFLSKVLWMLWHLIGTALAVWVWQIRRGHLKRMARRSIRSVMGSDEDDDDDGDDDDDDDDYDYEDADEDNDSDDDDDHDDDLSGLTLFLDVSVVLMCYLIVGPIQSSILKYTMEAFPTILKLVKKIEDLDFESKVKARYKKIRCSKIILRRRDEVEAQQQRDQLDEMEQHPVITTIPTIRRFSTISTVSELYHEGPTPSRSALERQFSRNPVLNKLVTKGYDILPKIWIATILVLGVIAFGIVCHNAIFTDDLKYEVKLVLMCFYLVFPVITTWFCIVLIEHHRNMYKLLARMTDDAFRHKENNMLKDIVTYLNTLQRLFQKLSENIFEFVLGINFAIFTIISTACTYEILQNLHILQGEGSKDQFSDIVYVFPLAICIWCIYAVCKRTHDLKNRAYDHLRIRLKEMLPELLLEGEEKIFKKVEILYKNLKDWPPQVCIYGGFKVTHSILVGVLFFSFAYARTFNRLSRKHGGGTDTGNSSTPCNCS